MQETKKKYYMSKYQDDIYIAYDYRYKFIVGRIYSKNDVILMLEHYYFIIPFYWKNAKMQKKNAKKKAKKKSKSIAIKNLQTF